MCLSRSPWNMTEPESGIDNMPKFCKDCLYYQDMSLPGIRNVQECRNPDYAEYLDSYYVDGIPYRPICENARKYENLCGIEGRGFKQSLPPMEFFSLEEVTKRTNFLTNLFGCIFGR